MKIISVLTLLFAVAFAITDAQLPAGKCTTTGYMTALASCSSQLSIDFMKYLGKMDHIQGALDKFCKNGLFDKTIECVQATNKMCDYALFSVDVLNVAKTAACKDFKTIISKSNNCKISSAEFAQFSSCMKTITINQNNPVCSALSKGSMCLKKLVNCPDTIKDYVGKGMTALAKHECDGDKQKDGGCSLVSYLGSAGACYSKYAMALAESISRTTLNASFTTITNKICSVGERADAFQCHKALDAKCKWSLFDAAKTEKTYNDACTMFATMKDEQSLAKCVQTNLPGLTQCYEKEVRLEGDTCTTLRKDAKCIIDSYKSCPDYFLTAISSLADFFMPKICSDKSSVVKCTGFEYMYGISACYVQSALHTLSKLVPGVTPQTTCSKDTVSEASACIKKVDNLCKFSLWNTDEQETAMYLTCSDPEVMQKTGVCLQENAAAFGSIANCDGLNLMSKSFSTAEDVCKHSHDIYGCFLDVVKDKKCDDNVRKLFVSTVNTLQPKLCEKNMAFSTKAAYLTFFIPFIARLF